MNQILIKSAPSKENYNKNINEQTNIVFHQEKSLKQLFLKKPKENLIEKIQCQLTSKFNLKVADKKLFQLTCYVNHYQTLNCLINENIKKVSQTIQKFKNTDNTSPKKYYNTKSSPRSQKSNQSKIFVKIASQSYRFKCLKQFFQIQNYNQKNIINTIVNKIYQKVGRGQIITLDNRSSTRRISIVMHHKRQNSDPNRRNNLNLYSKTTPLEKLSNSKNYELTNTFNVKENIMKNSNSNKEKNQKLVLPKINILQQKNNLKNLKHVLSFNQTKINEKMIKKIQLQTIQKQRTQQKCVKLSPLSTFKSFKGQSRRNGIHEVNRILNQMSNLKQKLKSELSTGQEVMKIASSLKHRLNQLLCSLKVKNTVKNECPHLQKVR